MRAESNRYVAVFDRRGEYPVQVKFTAAVRASNDWNSVDFQVAPGAPQPFVLQGLAADTQFQFPGASRPERKGNEFTSYLPSDGMVKLSWKEARKAGEGKLFYAAEMLAQVSVSPGLMQQTALLDFKVMQGELNRVSLFLHGDGEVTRVSGDQVLAWNLEPVSGSADRRLVIQLNQPQKDSFSLQVQLQTSLGAFPQTAEAMRLQPEGATRFAGYFRVVNEGAVRLEVAQASGLSQISPEQFPESDVTRAALRVGGSQRFAYRFSSADYGLRVQADQIQPELSVSEILAYNHGQNELAIDAEIELDVREAPLRELLLRVPKGYAIARINASGMSDYFLSDPLSRPSDSLSPSDGAKGSSDQNDLRIIYGQPVSGRQVIQLRLERNKPLDETSWNLPRVEVAKAKSVRGNIGISADAGFRLSAERSQSLTEIATAFFPRKVANLQTAFRISDPAWEATMRVERLPQTVQADALHLFSIGEGVAYGSSVINYQISGAPLSLLRVELSDEYFNVEFTGKDVRNWQKTTNGYVVQLHSPVSGAYTLLATYERPFKSAGETLAFTGAQPLGVQSEQGHTIVISSYQFQVTPADVSSGLMVLEPGEVPAEYRLFFDAPILAAYRYTARPFDLRLALHPLEQGDSLNQVIDRAALETRVSQEGQVLTDARYFVKSRGNPNLRVTLPAGTRLWSAVVNDATVVPVLDVRTNIDSTRASAGDTGASVDRSLLIPLPQHAAPDAILRVQLKLAQTNDAKRVSVTAPILAAPVMLAEWTLTPDAGQRLIFRRGTLTPAGGATDVSGFAGVMRIFTAREAGEALMSLLVTWVLVGAALVVWRWTARTNPRRYSARHLGGALIGLIAIGAAIPFLMRLAVLAEQQRAAIPAGVALVAPVQAANSALTVEVANVADRMSTFGRIVTAWPALLALAVWVYGATADTGLRKTLALAAGWTCLIWAVLRFPNSAPAFVWLFATFLAVHVAVPALRRLWQLPRDTEAPQGPAPAISPVVTGWCIGALLALSCGTTTMAAEPVSHSIPNAPAPESVVQDIRVEDKFALATARIRWRVTRGDVLPLLQEPAVLTRATFPPRAFTLMQLSATDRNQQLRAEQTGVFDIELQYQIQIAAGAAEGSFTLPVRSGLINQLTITLANADVDVLSPQAVSVRREMAGSNTVATVVLSPADGARVAWRPRSRDVKSEKPVFYAEISQLYVPSAGVIEGAHLVAIRPAQGELSEITFDVPSGATVTDVTDGASANPKSEIRNPNSLVSLWRFDPDARKLRVTLSRAQSKPFTLLVLSQVATGTLPFGQNLGLLSVEGAASQIGLLGIATGNEVQLDDVSAEQFSPINLEDFPANAVQVMAAQFPGLTVRRAFRYSTPMTLDGSGFGSGTFSGSGRAVSKTFSLKASAVEPDVRVETQNTLSIGEDRTVLAANVSVDITRAGIFRLSFIMPPGFEVESISGSALSHWTESKTADGRAITMHFPAKTVGQRQFTISLAGPGVHATNAWSVPQLVIREAGKQQGTLLIVPEQGMRLQVAARDGVTQLDPQKSGIKQKGVLAFRVLETPANLTLDLEQVDPWIQVASLQHAIVSEAQVKIAANLQYQIENTGLKAFRVFVPTNAESVRFEGEQVADFLATPGALTNGLQEWTVKLHRRVIGPYLAPPGLPDARQQRRDGNPIARFRSRRREPAARIRYRPGGRAAAG